MVNIKENMIFLNKALIGYITYDKGKWRIDIIDSRFLIRHIEDPNRDNVISMLISEIYSR